MVMSPVLPKVKPGLPHRKPHAPQPGGLGEGGGQAGDGESDTGQWLSLSSILARSISISHHVPQAALGVSEPGPPLLRGSHWDTSNSAFPSPALNKQHTARSK